MSLFPALVATVLHWALMLAGGPLLLGLIDWMAARMTGRRGASPLLPWRDLLRLARKQPVLAENASPFFVAAPYVQCAALTVAALLVPSFTLDMASAPAADLLVIAGLLALARCALALAAMDIGAASGGGAADRLVTVGALAEPALLLVILALALIAGTTNLEAVVGLLGEDGAGAGVSLALAALATAAVALAETGRGVFEDRHPEGEAVAGRRALVLEYSGRDLALIEAGKALRLMVWLTLIGTLFLPFGLAPADGGPEAWLIGLLCWAAKLVAMAAGLALCETMLPRLGPAHARGFLGFALLLAILAVALLAVSPGLA